MYAHGALRPPSDTVVCVARKISPGVFMFGPLYSRGCTASAVANIPLVASEGAGTSRESFTCKELPSSFQRNVLSGPGGSLYVATTRSVVNDVLLAFAASTSTRSTA